MEDNNIKFAWNGLKVAGQRKLAAKGHWSYQQARPEMGISEHVTFYASDYSESSEQACKALGGTGSRSTHDDCFYRAKVTLTPADARWSDAMRATLDAAKRTLTRMQRAADKAPSSYNRSEVAHQVARIERLEVAVVPPHIDPMLASLEALIGPL